MLHDVDRSLRALLSRCLPDGTAVEFGAPPSGEPETLLLNGFLYDIREDVSSLAAYAEDIRSVDGTVSARRMPIRRYRLRYLLTAWTGPATGVTEHELLAAVLTGCVEHQTIPADCLVGSLAGIDQLVTLRCAPADEEPLGPDIWARLGVLPRTTLDVVVIAPLLPPARTELAEPPAEFDLRPAPHRSPERPAESPGRRARGRISEPS